MTVPACDPVPAAVAMARKISTINPATGLSTDYLNHFTEAIMVLEMAAAMPDCLEDLRNWTPKSYREHFAASSFSSRDAVIAAYDGADPAVRDALDQVADTLNAALLETREVFLNRYAGPDTELLTQRALGWLRPLAARAAAIINGSRECGETQAAVDALFSR